MKISPLRIGLLTMCAVAMAASAGTTSASAAVVIGNWESGAPEGWIDWNAGGAVLTIPAAGALYAFNGVGATLGTGALQYNHAGGYKQWASIKLHIGPGNGNPIDGNGVQEWRDDFLASAKLAFDLTLIASEADPVSGNDFTTIGLYVNAQGYGFTPQGDPESVTPFSGYGFSGNNAFNPQNLAGTQTATWVYDIADTHDGSAPDITVSPNPLSDYIELILESYSNGQVVFHLDNVRLIGVGPLAGDFDESGLVAGADLTNWKTNFGLGAGATHMQGDADADGDVDGADVAVWQRQLGQTPVVASISAAPEPAALLLGALATAALAAGRRRRA